MDKEIIMFNMSSYSEWQEGVVNRNFHIFNYFIENQDIKRVIAVDFLPFTFKRAIRNYRDNIIRKSKIPAYRTGRKNQKSKIIYRDLTTKCVRIDREGTELYIFSTIDSIFSRKLVIKKLNRILKIINNQSTINNQQSTIRTVYSCFPMFVDYFSNLKSDLTIFDAIDNWIEHPSFTKYQSVLRKNYKIISEKSDLIFTVSEGLKEFFEKQGRTKNVYWIPNGVDINHFTPRTLGSDPGVGVMDNVLRPIVGYLGTIQHRFDVELLEHLAENNPKKSFVLAGPIWQSEVKERLRKYKNIYLTGRIPYSQSSDYINSFDVAIIPHKLDKFIKSTYSLKLLEYLACGRPVVTTPTPETKEFQDVIYQAVGYEEFNQKINLALKEDSMSLRDKRVERIKRESWEIKIGEMMKIIGSRASKLFKPL